MSDSYALVKGLPGAFITQGFDLERCSRPQPWALFLSPPSEGFLKGIFNNLWITLYDVGLLLRLDTVSLRYFIRVFGLK